GADRRRRPARHRGDRRPGREAADSAGHAPAARGSSGQYQGRRRGDQGAGPPMSEQQSRQEALIQQQAQDQQETPSEQDIQAEIEQTRERLGGTVEELVAKTDVKARAKDKAAELKAKAQVKAADVKTKAQV